MTDSLPPTPQDSALLTAITAEARQYTWAQPEPDQRPTSVQLSDAQAELTTALTQRDLAQADADRHLRNARYLGGLLEQIARTLGADPLDFAEVPALVDGLRTTADQLGIKSAAHALDRAEAGATLWKTRLVHEGERLRGHLAKGRLTTARAEARAGAYCLAYDHLDAVTRKLVDAIRQHINREPLGVHHLLTQADRDRLLDATDTVNDALSRDMESYLAEPYDDITADTRVDLTPAGLAVASVPRVARESSHWTCTECRYQNSGIVCTHCGFIPADNERARQSGDVDAEYSPAAGRLIGRLMDAQLTYMDRLGFPDNLGRDVRMHWWRDLAPIIAAEVDALAPAGVSSLDNRPPAALSAIVVGSEVVAEAVRPGAPWGDEDRRDGTSKLLAGMADDARRDREHAAAQGQVTWLDLLAEAFWAAMAEEDAVRLHGALVEVAAAALAWAGAIDRRAVEVAAR